MAACPVPRAAEVRVVLDLAVIRPELLAEARATWRGRCLSEYRSSQIMARFAEEVAGVGDPAEVRAFVEGLVAEEIAHAGLCADVCVALGVEPAVPEPLELADPPGFLALPMAERAAMTAISMLAINETISGAVLADLAARCTGPLAPVLAATIGDEEGHADFGWSYVARSLARLPLDMLPRWRGLVRHTLEPFVTECQRVLPRLPSARRSLADWPDTERAPLALFSRERRALVTKRVLDDEVLPRLAKLGLA